MFVTDEDLINLPEDDEEAFMHLVSLYRESFKSKAALTFNSDDFDTELDDKKLSVSYINELTIAIKKYDIKINLHDLPGVTDPRIIMKEFDCRIDTAIFAIRLNRAERARKSTVKLDNVEREKIRALLKKLRSSVDVLDLSDDKKARLYNRINELQQEVDDSRTKLEAYGVMAAAIYTVLPKVANAAEPLVQQLERIGRALGIAQEKEENSRLFPSREKPKRIEPPNKEEEIPF